MKVRELIARLNEMPGDTVVFLPVGNRRGRRRSRVRTVKSLHVVAVAMKQAAGDYCGTEGEGEVAEIGQSYDGHGVILDTRKE